MTYPDSLTFLPVALILRTHLLDGTCVPATGLHASKKDLSEHSIIRGGQVGWTRCCRIEVLEQRGRVRPSGLQPPPPPNRRLLVSRTSPPVIALETGKPLTAQTRQVGRKWVLLYHLTFPS